MKKILITTGGSGGHVIPAKIIEEHLNDNYEIFFTSDLRGLEFFSLKDNKSKIIDTPKIGFNFFLPFNLTKMVYLIFQSIFFLKKKKNR